MTPSHGLLSDHPPPSIPLLLEWLVRERAYVHPYTRIADIPDAGWGVLANGLLEPQELLFNIPTSAILSSRTSSLALLLDTIATQRKSTAAPILQLSLCLLHEFRLEKKSRWYGYLQSLPRETILLPALWSVAELCGDDGVRGLQWLQGTEAARDLKCKAEEGFALNNLSSYYSLHLPLLPPTASHPSPSPFISYLHAFSLVTTRAFLIDLYHTIALVPFADLLNHSSTNPSTSLGTDSFVCHICGSLAPCPHDPLASGDVPYRLLDTWKADPADYRRMITADHTVEMRMERTVRDGEEIMNSYGADMGDARLLVEWGYIPEEFGGDGLTWDREILSEDAGVKREWLELLAGGLQVELREALDADEESMICLSPEKKGVDLFNLNHAGQIGANLWAFLYISQKGVSSTSAQDLIHEIIESVRAIEMLAEEGEDGDGDLGEATSATLNAVIHLLEERLAGLHRPDLTLEKLFSLRDNLPPTSKLERMALTLCINERSLLESSLHRWRDLLRPSLHAMS